MSQRSHLLLITLSAVLLCGCTADTTPTPATSEEPTATTSSTTESTTVPGTETLDSTSAVTPPTNQPEDSDADIDQLGGGQVKELTTGQDYLEAIQAQLRSETGDAPPSSEKIAAAVALAEEGYAKLPEDSMMLKLLANLLHQTLQLESDDVANARRLRLGELARVIAKGTEPNDAMMAQVLLLEEAKGRLAENDFEKAWDSVTEARSLGFDQVEYLFYDPGFEPLLNNDEVAATVKSWLAESIDAEFAANEEFPFDFTLQSFSGEEVSLSDFEGKPVIVDIWGTWCGPCVKAIPHLVELQDEYKDEIAIVGINFENQGGGMPFEEAKARVDQFIETQPINYSCLHGQPETLQSVPNFEGFPTMLFLDGSGKVRLKMTGYLPKQKLEVIVDKLLAEQPGA